LTPSTVRQVSLRARPWSRPGATIGPFDCRPFGWSDGSEEQAMDPLAVFKDAQKKGWAHFAPLEAFTTPCAARLVAHAGIRRDQRMLDVGCGTGVVAVTAARTGARATGLDLTPELLAHARENAQLAGVEVAWHEGDVERLPFADASFEAVISQFGHMFAPRPEVAIAEMLRVLAPGGTIAFSTWPPELMIGRAFTLVAQYAPPPPPGVSPPSQWGDPSVVRQRLGTAVKGIVFDRAVMLVPALSPAQNRVFMERTAGPVLKLVESLSTADPARLAKFRQEYEALVADYLHDNVVRQDYLLTRATKA
jgi:SAM-dependent methyltransferase